MRTYLCTIAFVLFSIEVSLAWSEYEMEMPKPVYLVETLAYCDDEKSAEALIRRMAFGWRQVHEHVAILNHDLDSASCRYALVVIRDPELVKAFLISVWDVAIYRVWTRHGTKYVPVRKKSQHRNA